jgi:hypothetical protein
VLAALHTLPGVIIAAAAVLVALGVIGKYLRQWFRWFVRLGNMVRAMDEIISRELEHNHGSSMKDDVHGIAVAVGVLQRRFGELARKQQRDHRAVRDLIEEYHPAETEEPTQEEK